ncbi:unnamed protein product [Moneuplotes crassus]|uniref:Cyclic nucleotide-binding domain-containing protein n=1 Tax=Euplotes crassus TaxID=5936 RepID=A0AAD1XNV0_EUPCR|nr:unnamed protein product [Moneuplotes crassus]
MENNSEYSEPMDQNYPTQYLGENLETNTKLLETGEEPQRSVNYQTPTILSAVKMAGAQDRLDKVLSRRKKKQQISHSKSISAADEKISARKSNQPQPDDEGHESERVDTPKDAVRQSPRASSAKEDLLKEKEDSKPKDVTRKSIFQQNDIRQIYQSELESEITSDERASDSQNSGRKFRCLFRAHDKNKLRWDLYIMLLATLNCFQVPYTLAFSEEGEEPLFLSVINWLLDVSFIIDLIIGFRSTYVNEKTGKEIVDLRLIALQYFKGRFFIDLLASIPFDIFSLFFFGRKAGGFSLQLISLLKLVRVLRLSKLIAFMNLQNDMKMSLKLIKLVFFLILYLHCAACLWFYIVKQKEMWIPPLNEISEANSFFLKGSFDKYCISLYYSILTLAGNDLFPQDTTQVIFAIILVLAGAIINANIFGNIAVLLQQINRKAANFQEKLDNATSAMKSLGIEEELQKKIQLHLMSTQDSLDLQEELNLFLRMLTPSLKLKVTQHIFIEAISSNPVFHGEEEAIEIMIKSMNLLLFYPEQEIVKQGEPGYKFYFIAQGQCDVFINDAYSSPIYEKTLETGNYFGEVAIIKNCKRTATIKSQSFSTCSSLEYQAFLTFLEEYPILKTNFTERMKTSYNDHWRKFTRKCLRNVDYLKNGISDEILDEISFTLESCNLATGYQLIKAGTICNEIILICCGKIEVSICNVTGSNSYIDTLSTCSTIGSYSALSAEDHIINAICNTSCKILILKFEVIEKLREQYEELDLNLEKHEDYIEEYGIPYCDFHIYRETDDVATPLLKFQQGILRIIRIIKAYKTTRLTDLLGVIQKDIRKKRKDKLKRKQKLLLRNLSNPDQMTQEAIFTRLNEKMDYITSKVESQSCPNCACNCKSKPSSLPKEASKAKPPQEGPPRLTPPSIVNHLQKSLTHTINVIPKTSPKEEDDPDEESRDMLPSIHQPHPLQSYETLQVDHPLMQQRSFMGPYQFGSRKSK